MQRMYKLLNRPSLLQRFQDCRTIDYQNLEKSRSLSRYRPQDYQMQFEELPTSGFSMMHVKFMLVPMKAMPVALGRTNM